MELSASCMLSQKCAEKGPATIAEELCWVGALGSTRSGAGRPGTVTRRNFAAICRDGACDAAGLVAGYAYNAVAVTLTSLMIFEQEKLHREARENKQRLTDGGGISPRSLPQPEDPRIAALEARLKQADEHIHQLVTHGGTRLAGLMHLRSSGKSTELISLTPLSSSPGNNPTFTPTEAKGRRRQLLRRAIERMHENQARRLLMGCVPMHITSSEVLRRNPVAEMHAIAMAYILFTCRWSSRFGVLTKTRVQCLWD